MENKKLERWAKKLLDTGKLGLMGIETTRRLELRKKFAVASIKI